MDVPLPPLLAGTLPAVIPLHIAELRKHGATRRRAVMEESARTLADHAGDLADGGDHQVLAFAALGRAIAALALFSPNGFAWRDMHWCSSDDCPGPDAHDALLRR